MLVKTISITVAAQPSMIHMTAANLSTLNCFIMIFQSSMASKVLTLDYSIPINIIKMFMVSVNSCEMSVLVKALYFLLKSLVLLRMLNLLKGKSKVQ